MSVFSILNLYLHSRGLNLFRVGHGSLGQFLFTYFVWFSQFSMAAFAVPRATHRDGQELCAARDSHCRRRFRRVATDLGRAPLCVCVGR